MDSTFLSSLDWRNAEKHFDPEKKIPQEDFDKILHAIKMAPSSFGLQPYHVYVVADQATKLQLKEKGFNQQQFADASQVLIFCGRNDLTERINKYFEIVSGGDAEKRKTMEGYEGMMNGFAEGKSPDDVMGWAFKQTYIALGFALAACAELRIDACPMEGFDPKAFDQILNLPSSMNSVAVMTIGYRKETTQMPKMRFPDEDLFSRVG